MTHLVNNSLAHGIESTPQRQAAGKPKIGQIYIDVVDFSKNHFTLRYRDDGSGLNLKKLRDLNHHRKQMNSDHEVASTIFSSSISTSDNVDEISGRGVGMDAVVHELKKVDGSIDICFEGPESNNYRPFSFRMTLPRSS